MMTNLGQQTLAVFLLKLFHVCSARRRNFAANETLFFSEPSFEKFFKSLRIVINTLRIV